MSEGHFPYFHVGIACVIGLVCIVAFTPGGDVLKPDGVGSVEHVQRSSAPHKAPERSVTAADGSGTRAVAFSGHMGLGAGTPIVNSSGGMNLESVQVAVVGPSGKVEFVKGTDRRAVETLNRAREDQENMIVDKGPLDIDLGTVPGAEVAKGFGGLGGRRLKIAAPKEVR